MAESADAADLKSYKSNQITALNIMKTIRY